MMNNTLGPPIQELLKQALSTNNVVDIEGQVVKFNEFRLLVSGDLWAGKAICVIYLSYHKINLG